MNLNEVGNRPYKFKKTASTKRRWNAVFTTDGGANYIFDAELHGLANWRVSFQLMKAHPRGGTLADFGITGTEGTNAVRVLGTVKEIFEKFVKEVNPDTVIFVAEKLEGSGRGSRSKLYNRFAKTFARDYGYELDKDESGSETEFAFYKINEVYRKSGLGKWFHSQSAGGSPGWDRYDGSGKKAGKCGDSKPGEPYAACLSKQKAASLGKKGVASFVRRKRAAQNKAGKGDKDIAGKGNKPINVSYKTKKARNEMLSFLDYSLAMIVEKNEPTNPKLWSSVLSQARSKFDVFPSAYASAWAAKKYKSKGGGWRVAKEEFEQVDEKSAAWTRKAGQNPEGGLNAKGRASYERENPGSDLKPPVSASQAKKSPKSAARRKSFCARMGGMKGPMKDEKGRPTRKALALRKWDC